MPLYGWDLSHYDGPDARPAIAQGFTFITHKAGGDANDAELAAWWTYMKPYRITVDDLPALMRDGYVPGKFLPGAYWVLYPGDPAGRADAFLARLDSQCPGWRDAPFILQTDAEIWGGDTSTKPSVAECNAFADRLAAEMAKLVPIGYLPKWVYGAAVAAYRYPLWASSYVSGSGSASALYPGDNSSHWDAYGGRTPAILQYTSSATIAGQTTCDANAYRGTLAELVALLAPGWVDDMGYTVPQMQALPWQYTGGGIPPNMSTLNVLNEILLNSRAQALRDEALLSAVLNESDTTAILARIDARAAELAAAVDQVDEEVWAKVPDPGVPVADKAALLKAVLGKDAEAVGRALAGL